MLIRRFRGSAKCLMILFIFILTWFLYREYRSQGRQISAEVDNEENKNYYKLIIIVLSAPNNFEQREAIRRTWLSETPENVKYFFAVSTLSLESEKRENLNREEKRSRDLLLLPNLQDSYKSLTQKVLQLFSKINEDFRFDYLLKCDDDSLVLVDKLLNELEKRELDATSKELYWGFFNGKAQVKRSGPWKENDWIFCDFYLPYALGGGYVLSYRLVQFIANNSNILRIYNSEDVSVGLWLSPLSNIERRHDVRFDTEYRSRGCSNEYIITHKQTAKTMNNIYQTYKASGAMCLKEIKNRNSYEYDWKVPPSKCCIRQPGIP